MQYKKTATTKAFTLVELSIVLIVMGFIVTAAMSGQELLKTAKLRSVIAEVEDYKVAYNSFQVQFEALPGDIKNATSFWTTTQNGGTAVANGDGNAQIGTNLAADRAEPYYLWSHLTLAKLVAGTFSGSSASSATPGTNIPLSKSLDAVGFSIAYSSSAGGFAYVDQINRSYAGNFLIVGKADGSTPYSAADAFKPSDAAYIDTKMDDGKPKSGKVLSGDYGVSGGGNCIDATDTTIYRSSLDTESCVLYISLDNK